jgi:exonuclease VII small subunit
MGSSSSLRRRVRRIESETDRLRRQVGLLERGMAAIMAIIRSITGRRRKVNHLSSELTPAEGDAFAEEMRQRIGGPDDSTEESDTRPIPINGKG